MRRATLKEHKQIKKKLVTPFNKILGGMVTFNAWYYRMPSLLWLGLIIDKYGHTNGLTKCHYIMNYMIDNYMQVEDLNITHILKLEDKKKELLFDYINLICEDKILDCLCLVTDDKIFRNKNYNINNTSEKRINALKTIMQGCFSKYSELACDIRFFFLYQLIYTKKVIIGNDNILIDSLDKYYKTSHSEEIMKIYSSSVRAFENAYAFKENPYPIIFWNIVGNISDCDLYLINYQKGDYNKMQEFYKDINTECENILSNNFENKNVDKFIVLSGLLIYSTKLLKEVCDNSLHNSISSRILLRTIIDVYITIKYLLLIESEHTDIWKGFQEYGLSKYKLIYKKSTEMYEVNENSHLSPKLLDLIVNDGNDEDWLDIDLGYFDKTSIIEKFKGVDEKELYDTLYDYDVSYAHAHWGAIRESSMLKCDNPLHQYHIVADVMGKQTSKSTEYDYIKIFYKILRAISSQYIGISDDFFKKYEGKV